MVKNFSKCNPPDFKFDPSKLNNKDFPYTKKQRKINITPYGENFYS